jgi:hypothetical protein
MIKPIAVAMVCILPVPAVAQTSGDVASRYTDFMKSRVAVKVCVSEEGQMQIARNEHYDALLKANAKDPAAPTIDEMTQARAQLRSEDEALSQKRDECAPLFDQLVAAARGLRRDCAAYVPASTENEPAEAIDEMAIAICRGPAKTSDTAKAQTP